MPIWGPLLISFGSVLVSFGTVWVRFESVLVSFGSVWVRFGSVFISFGKFGSVMGALRWAHRRGDQGPPQGLQAPLVQHVELHIVGLPSAADGYVLCMLSDLHAGPIAGSGTRGTPRARRRVTRDTMHQTTRQRWISRQHQTTTQVP